jgi:hypothetical protein
MAERTKTHIKKAERRFSNLKQANEVVPAASNKRFGLDVSALKYSAEKILTKGNSCVTIRHISATLGSS